MAEKIIQDRYTGFGVPDIREKDYNGATVESRTIEHFFRPNLDLAADLTIETQDDADVVGRPWDDPSEISVAGRYGQIGLQFPRFKPDALIHFAGLAVSQMSKADTTDTNTYTLIPKNLADDLTLWSSGFTINYVPTPPVGPNGVPAIGAHRADADGPKGVIRAYDGLFVNDFEISVERGIQRYFQLSVNGYFSGNYTDQQYIESGETGEAGQFHLNRDSAHADTPGNVKSQFVDDSVGAQSDEHGYIRGTQCGMWLASGDSYFAADQKVATNRSRSWKTHDWVETNNTISKLADLVYNVRFSFNNNVNLEDLFRIGSEGGDAIGIAERTTAATQLVMEFDFQDYQKIDNLFNQDTLGFQMICQFDSTYCFNLFMPRMRVANIGMGRQGSKRTQTLTLRPLAPEAGTAPWYLDIAVKDSIGNILNEEAASPVAITDRK